TGGASPAHAALLGAVAEEAVVAHRVERRHDAPARRLDALLARALDAVARARERLAGHAGAAGAALSPVADEAVVALRVARAVDRRASDAGHAHRAGRAARRVRHELAAARRFDAAVVRAVHSVVAADGRAGHALAVDAPLLTVAEETVGAGFVARARAGVGGPAVGLRGRAVREGIELRTAAAGKAREDREREGQEGARGGHAGRPEQEFVAGA